MIEIFLRASAAVTILALAIVAYKYDRLRGRTEIQKIFLEAHLVKALRDGRHIVRIPAAVLKAGFQLSTRVHQDPSNWNSKPGRHPALERKVRRDRP